MAHWRTLFAAVVVICIACSWPTVEGKEKKKASVTHKASN
jgi:hypothetical protein